MLPKEQISAMSLNNNILALNAQANIWIQESLRSSFMDGAMEAFSFLADVRLLILLIPFYFWFTKHKRITLMLFLSPSLAGFLNTFLKTIFAIPRPFVFTPDVVNVAEPHLREYLSYSFPSGHSQLAASLYIIIFLYARTKWIRNLSLLAIVLVGFSRIYLGMHYPMDVLCGWMIGIFGSYFVFRHIHLSPTSVCVQRVKLLLYSGLGLSVVSLFFLAHSFDLYRSIGVMLSTLVATLLIVRKREKKSKSLPERTLPQKILAGGIVLLGYVVIVSIYVLAKIDKTNYPLAFFCYAVLPIWMLIAFPKIWAAFTPKVNA